MTIRLFRPNFLRFYCFGLHHLRLLREFPTFRRGLYLFFLLLVGHLFGDFVDCSSPRTNLVVKLVGLVFADVPFQTEKLVRVSLDYSSGQFIERFQVFQR